jgi:hypothetical protein
MSSIGDWGFLGKRGKGKGEVGSIDEVGIKFTPELLNS